MSHYFIQPIKKRNIMKRTTVILLFTMQLLTMAGVGATIYITFMNKARIRATQRVLVETQEKLAPTIAVMNDVAIAKKEQEKANEPIAKGTIAPEFSLPNEKGIPISLSDLKGKKTLLVFSQESCPYCEYFYPILNKFEENQNEVRVVIMQLGSTVAQNAKYKIEKGIKAPLLAATSQLMNDYKIKGTPTSILLDVEGRVLGTENITQMEELITFVRESD